MAEKNLIIVESPAKAKTIKKYSGSKDVDVLASYGHVRDLLSKDGAVDGADFGRSEGEVYQRAASLRSDRR